MLKKITLLALVAMAAISIGACTAAKAAIIPEVNAAPVSEDRAEASAAPRTITVVGEGSVTLEPDVATINVGAEARSDSVSEAKAQVEAYMTAVAESLQELDITGPDIQTSHFSIHYEREPLPRMPDQPQEFRDGYYVSNMVRVTIRDVEKAGEVLDAVVQAGANQVYGVNYSVADKTSWQRQARAQAVADARSRAEELAKLADVDLGAVLSISEIIGGMPVPTILAERGMGGGGFAAGELDLTTQLQVTFGVQ